MEGIKEGIINHRAPCLYTHLTNRKGVRATEGHGRIRVRATGDRAGVADRQGRIRAVATGNSGV